MQKNVYVHDSGKYKEYLEMIEHVERDLQTFRSVTKQLADHVNQVYTVQYVHLAISVCKLSYFSMTVVMLCD